MLGLVYGLIALLFNSAWFFNSALFIAVVMYLLFFSSFWYCWVAALIAGITLWTGFNLTQQRKNEILKLRFFSILRPAISALVSGLILLTACAWYASPWVDKGIEEIEIPRPLFNLIFKPLQALFFNQVTDKAVNAAGFFQGQALSVMIEDVGDQFSEQIYQLTNERLRSIIKLYQNYISVGLALALLAGLRALSIPFVFLIILICWLLIKALMKLKVIKIEHIQVQKEVLRI